MQILGRTTRIDFLGRRRIAAVVSGLLMLVSLVSLLAQGLVLGLDFTGGTLIEVAYPRPVELSEVRQRLAGGGLGDVVVQHFGTARDVLIRVAPREGLASADVSTRVLELLQEEGGGPAMRRVEFVGPQVGEELAEKGGLAMLYALIGILLYVAFRFEYRFALGAVAALVHDVLITLGFFSVFRIEVDLTVLAAVLAVIGYSLNDTIVVFDRIRENFRKMRRGSALEVMNASINQTISRTLMTSLTTLLVLVALFAFGGEIIHGFALALIVGIVVGTYSSIFIASPAALALGVSRSDLVAPKREEAADDRP
ncbi:protein translocase subunit SecF [Inmirania thermothiophila]|uniref:protein translocase subunit SecF n=1 Tax=Inmirania thermothiophila TaxID=1750597 RepID=UPI000F49829D|nr:protein translocase subunit SecF [Inmirania thermothiophila]